MNPNTKDINHINRRSFIRLSACAAVGTSSLFSTLFNLRQLNAATTETNGEADDYKAIVCIFLYGGNDANNLLVPTDQATYSLYAAGREQLALARESLLPLNALNSDGRSFGIHPSMTGCHELFNNGSLALVANVGTLLAPATLSDFRNRTAAIPDHLFSHSDQQVLWQTSVNENAAIDPTGWGGRIADLLHARHNDSSISMLVSLSGSNFFQVGDTLLPFRTDSRGSSTYDILNGWDQHATTRAEGFRSLLEKDYAHVMERAFADISNTAIKNADTFNAAIENASDFEMIPDSGLGNQLRMVAKLIQSRQALGQKRQVFFVATGGFDTHGPQLGAHAGLLGGLDSAIKGFHDALASIEAEDKVTSFTASDFGRTFDTNGRGSDHGWGSHHIVMGGAVKGQNIYGQFPDIQMGSDQDTGRGRWLPTTSVDQYGATMARWFGVPESELATVFPNIGNFGSSDLGFMNS
ncbi:DUF1501 domain-containing protein [Pelagicoccus sp. SDUM812003]|uniref:DUF1501 domain-containing protein n=1 Tax=Pelagicoccus sp. SDUM812003 TaxID=3041267 RepID=UPI00280FE4CB|nr:DUF1501 domain-containing protein [Pelagicoccus sp. SDUM812003]MDQ8204798.1 DUF1501 domain-containing protein [Pelagicoccus sp. SDUM812003]